MPLDELAPNGPALAGRDLLTLGTVLVDQELGSHLVIQLRALRPNEIARIDHADLTATVGGQEVVSRLLQSNQTDSSNVRQIVYCDMATDKRPSAARRTACRYGLRALANARVLPLRVRPGVRDRTAGDRP